MIALRNFTADANSGLGTMAHDNSLITQEEWQELVSLKKAIDGYPQSVSTCQQERFTELLVKSLADKGDRPLVDTVN